MANHYDKEHASRSNCNSDQEKLCIHQTDINNSNDVSSSSIGHYQTPIEHLNSEISSSKMIPQLENKVVGKGLGKTTDDSSTKKNCIENDFFLKPENAEIWPIHQKNPFNKSGIKEEAGGFSCVIDSDSGEDGDVEDNAILVDITESNNHGCSVINKADVKVEEESERLTLGYSQEPDTIFLSDSDVEMIMSHSKLVINLDFSSDSDTGKPATNIIVKQEKVDSPVDFEDINNDSSEKFSSAEDWSDQGSDFEPASLLKSLEKKQKGYSDTYSLSDEDIFESQRVHHNKDSFAQTIYTRTLKTMSNGTENKEQDDSFKKDNVYQTISKSKEYEFSSSDDEILKSSVMVLDTYKLENVKNISDKQYIIVDSNDDDLSLIKINDSDNLHRHRTQEQNTNAMDACVVKKHVSNCKPNEYCSAVEKDRGSNRSGDVTSAESQLEIEDKTTVTSDVSSAERKVDQEIFCDEDSQFRSYFGETHIDAASKKRLSDSLGICFKEFSSDSFSDLDYEMQDDLTIKDTDKPLIDRKITLLNNQQKEIIEREPEKPNGIMNSYEALTQVPLSRKIDCTYIELAQVEGGIVRVDNDAYLSETQVDRPDEFHIDDRTLPDHETFYDANTQGFSTKKSKETNEIYKNATQINIDYSTDATSDVTTQSDSGDTTTDAAYDDPTQSIIDYSTDVTSGVTTQTGLDGTTTDATYDAPTQIDIDDNITDSIYNALTQIDIDYSVDATSNVSTLKRPHSKNSSIVSPCSVEVDDDQAIFKKLRLAHPESRHILNEASSPQCTFEMQSPSIVDQKSMFQKLYNDTITTSPMDQTIVTNRNILLSKPPRKVLVSDAAGVYRKRARREPKKDESRYIDAPIQAAKSQLITRAMKLAVHPEITTDHFKKPVTSVLPSESDVSDVDMPTNSQIVSKRLPVLNPTCLLLKLPVSATRPVTPRSASVSDTHSKTLLNATTTSVLMTTSTVTVASTTDFGSVKSTIDIGVITSSSDVSTVTSSKYSHSSFHKDKKSSGLEKERKKEKKKSSLSSHVGKVTDIGDVGIVKNLGIESSSVKAGCQRNGKNSHVTTLFEKSTLAMQTSTSNVERTASASTSGTSTRPSSKFLSSESRPRTRDRSVIVCDKNLEKTLQRHLSPRNTYLKSSSAGSTHAKSPVLHQKQHVESDNKTINNCSSRLLQQQHSSSSLVSKRPNNMVNTTELLQWDDFLRVILKWNPVWFEEREKQVYNCNKYMEPPPVTNDLWGQDKHTLYPLVGRYETFKEYSEFMLPLMLYETWESCYSNWKEKKTRNNLHKQKLMFSNLEPDGENIIKYTLHGLTSEEDKRRGNRFNEGDLVKMSVGVQKLKTENKDSQLYNITGFVKKVVFKASSVNRICIHNQDMGKLRKNDSISVTLTVRVRSRSFIPDYNVLVEVESVSSITTTLRQFQALSYLPRSLLCTDLLKPSDCDTYHFRTVGSSVTLSKESYNESQFAAINSCVNVIQQKGARVCLIQGPPGTGKSHTIIGIIKNIIQVLKGQCRICLCAPSHAAVDVLVRRLLNANKNASISCKIKIVRLGTKSSVHPEVQSHCLDTLIQTNLLKAQKEELLRQLPQSLLGEMTALKTRISFLKRDLNVNKDALQKQKMMTDLKKLEQQKKKLEMVNGKSATVPCHKEWQIQQDLLRNAHVVAGTLSSIGSYVMKACFQQTNKEPAFNCVIIDEATQAIEPDTLIPLQYGVTKLILVGDPEQLPPTVLSQIAVENKLNMSLFERLQSHFHCTAFKPVIMLNIQYRMDPEIAMFPNKYIYAGKINNDISVLNRNQCPLVPYLLYDITEGKELFSQGCRSMSNLMEAEFTTDLCNFIVKKTCVPRHVIGIIAPYAKQKIEIRKQLNKRGLVNIEVSTVDGFQGQEKHVIIMSCVRANTSGTVGFVGNRNRMNVCLTRAKYAMYLVGHFDSLESSDEWKTVIVDAKQRKKIVTVERDSLKAAIEMCLKQRKSSCQHSRK